MSATLRLLTQRTNYTSTLRATHLVVLALGTLLVGGCASTAPPYLHPLRVQAPVGTPEVLTHRMAPRETLWSISKRYGVPYQHIMRANGLTDATQVPAGRVLVIPRLQVTTVRIPLYHNPQWTHIVVHHSAMNVGNARIIDRAHRRKGFKNGLGYHFVIDNGTAHRRDGQIEVGSRWRRQQQGAHCNAGGMNQHGIGICLIGDFTHQPPSAAQMDALMSLVKELRAFYKIPASRVIRHRDVPGKTTVCPGDRFPWTAFRRRFQ